jgi:hypothetical protein
VTRHRNRGNPYLERAARILGNHIVTHGQCSQIQIELLAVAVPVDNAVDQTIVLKAELGRRKVGDGGRRQARNDLCVGETEMRGKRGERRVRDKEAMKVNASN